MGRRDFDLSGARALVTGAGSGIGRAIALELARKGSQVLAVDQHGETAEKTALACGEVGPEAHGLACDVTDVSGMTTVLTSFCSASADMNLVQTCTRVASAHASWTALRPRAVRCDPYLISGIDTNSPLSHVTTLGMFKRLPARAASSPAGSAKKP